MPRIHNRRGLAREGQGARPPRNRILPTTTLASIGRPRGPRNWSRQNDSLVDRGDLTIFVDLDAVHGRRRGAGAGRGRPYPTPAILLAAVVQVVFHEPLRQAEGTTRMLWRLLGLTGRHPDYTTICRRRTTLDLDWGPPPPGGHVLIIDATGIRLDARRGWADDKPGADQRRGRYLKLHLGMDATTGLVLAAVITEADGAGSGDASCGPDLIDAAADWLGVEGWLDGGIGDGAYDAKSCYERIRRRGRGPWLAPPPDNARLGVDPIRDLHVGAQRRLGTKLWKERSGYHTRSLVESWNGAAKATVGLASRAHSFETQAAEVLTQVWVYHAGVVRCPIR